MKNLCVYIILCLIVFILPGCPPDNGNGGSELIDDWPEESIVEKTNSQTYDISVTVTLTNRDLDLTKIMVILPVPQSNPYQEVSNIELNGGKERLISGTSDKYASFVHTSDLPGNDESIQVAISYTVTLYDLTADLESISTINPYNTSSDIYKYYRGTSGTLVDPSNPDIVAWSETIMGESTDILSYA
ncbi:MAG: hypothetical protein JXB88_15125 [Spirochaetales bacterium]|nr:hypothetical protein [Spirochaetales bacterium]